jgi:hypothetical protein
MQPAKERLIARYDALEGSPPDWGYGLPGKTPKTPLGATIPFIGRRYFDSALRIVVYASAENLAHYERAPATVPAFLADRRFRDRHRAAHDEAQAAQPEAFWPTLHIGPVENGSLLCAALFLGQKLGAIQDTDGPRGLLDTLAAGNVGKYSLSGPKNRDYAGSLRLLKPSLPLLVADLEVLRPDVVLFPRAAYRLADVRALLASACPRARIVPLPQFNATVVNVHLAGRRVRALELERELAGTALADWMGRLRGYAPGHAYRYLAELEACLA